MHSALARILDVDKHIQEQTDILTHRKAGGPALGANMERALEVLIKVGLEGRLEGREGGF